VRTLCFHDLADIALTVAKRAVERAERAATAAQEASERANDGVYAAAEDDDAAWWTPGEGTIPPGLASDFAYAERLGRQAVKAHQVASTARGSLLAAQFYAAAGSAKVFVQVDRCLAVVWAALGKDAEDAAVLADLDELLTNHAPRPSDGCVT
jgi:hypothetical protein